MGSNIRENKVIKETEHFIKSYFKNEGSGHDWWHIYRVRNLALKISDKEGGNRFVIEMAALLHDLDDWKLVDTQESSKTQNWLNSVQVSKDQATLIEQIIEEVSFKGAGVETNASTIEAKIVQDADRLDALGAIGIARTFAYGGHKHRLLYHPDIKPELHDSFEAYKKTTAPTINHFYEKLLLLKDRINTTTAQKIATKRDKYMHDFLEHFFNEWDCKD